MKTKILILFATAIMYSTFLFSQRDATTGHSFTNNISTQAYIFGGQKGDGSLSNELWVTNEFNDFIPINASGGPSARKDHDAWIFGNVLYIKGGIDANGNCIEDLWGFDLLTNTWTQYSDFLPYCSFKKSTIKLNGKLYIAGGETSSGTCVSNFGLINLSNINSGYIPKNSMIEPLSGCGVFTKAGNIFLYGGINNDWDTNSIGNQPSYSQNVWKYNITTDSWELQTTSKNQIIELTEMAFTQDTLENFFYVFGGKTYDYGTNIETYSNEIYKLNLNTFSWTKSTTTLPYGLADFTATYKHGTDFNTDTIFLLGGQTATGTISTNLFKFLPSTSELITVPLSISTYNNSYDKKVSIYPNPAKELLYVENADENSIVTIYDITGKKLIDCKLQSKQVNIRQLVNGFYTIRIKSENGEIINKFVKQ